MISHEQTHWIRRAVVIAIEISIDDKKPSMLTGMLEVRDLDTGLRFEIGLCYLRHKPETHAAIAELQACAYPEIFERRINKPPPEISLEVTEGFDRSLRLVRFERKQP